MRISLRPLGWALALYIWAHRHQSRPLEAIDSLDASHQQILLDNKNALSINHLPCSDMIPVTFSAVYFLIQPLLRVETIKLFQVFDPHVSRNA